MDGENRSAWLADIKSIKIEAEEILIETGSGKVLTFINKGKVQPAITAAKKLLEKYEEERRKQHVAMRMSAKTAAERQDIKKMKYWDDSEIRKFEEIFSAAE